MSHISLGATLFADLEALQIAAERCGLEVVRSSRYTWYGRAVGDFPLPAGMKASELGKNAEFILRIKEPRYSELARQNGTKPYDVGIVKDRDTGLCRPVYDYFAGGYGLAEHVGAVTYKEGPAGTHPEAQLCPKLYQEYHKACDALAARAAGYAIEFLTPQELLTRLQADPNYLNEGLAAESEEVRAQTLAMLRQLGADSVVSVTRTAQRLGV